MYHLKLDIWVSLESERNLSVLPSTKRSSHSRAHTHTHIGDRHRDILFGQVLGGYSHMCRWLALAHLPSLACKPLDTRYRGHLVFPKTLASWPRRLWYLGSRLARGGRFLQDGWRLIFPLLLSSSPRVGLRCVVVGRKGRQYKGERAKLSKARPESCEALPSLPSLYFLIDVVVVPTQYWKNTVGFDQSWHSHRDALIIL